MIAINLNPFFLIFCLVNLGLVDADDIWTAFDDQIPDQILVNGITNPIHVPRYHTEGVRSLSRSCCHLQGGALRGRLALGHHKLFGVAFERVWMFLHLGDPLPT